MRDNSFSEQPEDAESAFSRRLAIIKSTYKAQLAFKEETEVTANLSSHSASDIVCRICLEAEAPSNAFISPCNCTGSVKHVHEECLKTWIVSQDEDCSVSKCELCGCPFQMDFDITTYCSCRQAFTVELSQCLFIPMMFVVLIMLLLVIFLLIDRFIYSEKVRKEKLYILSLFLTCLISACIIVYLIVAAIRESFCAERLDAWRILSREPAVFSTAIEASPNKFSILDEIDQTGADIVSEMPRPEQPPVMVVPDKIRIRGRLVNTPMLEPSLPVLSRREGNSRVFATPSLISFTSRDWTQRMQSSTSRVNLSGRSAISEVRG
jgi:hypothetical protein